MNVGIINKSEFDNPSYATSGSAGLDLRFSNFDGSVHNNLLLAPGERVLIGTDIYLDIPEGIEAQIRPRSGLALKKGITVLNSPGTIDCDYKGEIGIILINHSFDKVEIKYGDKIAQMVFTKYEHVRLDNITELSNSDRGQGGFGSTN